ncbi:hypothetical protein I6939_06230 [Helicobacter pylori]|nr:hypothetical protein [Helicobacter pylori]MBH0301046.1 hypothetical protein [Helicobacter pylori]
MLFLKENIEKDSVFNQTLPLDFNGVGLSQSPKPIGAMDKLKFLEVFL